jgi:hypothetical protein
MDQIMKNLAGNSVSIFLFRFVLRKNAISFVLNESIAEDMYPEIDEQIQPLVQACSETLLRYKKLSNGKTIMDGNILVDGCFEVMLSKGLGKHFAEREKQNLFDDAQEIANLLIEVMSRRSKESEQGTHPDPQPVNRKIQRTGVTNKGLEALGQKQHLLEELLWNASNKPGLNRLTPDDLPHGVIAKRGYDHRGHCLSFDHEILGELGKIILIDIEEDKTLMEAELSRENPEALGKKQKIFEEVVSIVEVGLSQATTKL